MNNQIKKLLKEEARFRTSLSKSIGKEIQPNYWVGIVSNQISGNYSAWAIYQAGFFAKSSAEKFATLCENLDWAEVPEGCSLGYQYIVFDMFGNPA